MADAGNDPNAWLGLLKWSLAHQDGTAPSEARPMSDADRAWLERVVSEGVRDDFQTMTDIYARLCSYLDRTAAAMHPSVPFNDGAESNPTPISGYPPAAAATTGQHVSRGDSERPVVSEQQQPVQPIEALPPAAAALSVFVAPPPAQPVPAPSSFEGGGGGEAGGEGLEDVMNDLEELQDMVEQIDLAATFAKIGGFGRLIALAAPPYRPEELRLRAASVMATLTKNNPPAQVAFSESGGHRALLQATNNAITAAATNSSAQAAGDTATAPPPQQPRTVSFALQRAILHALSCSVMGLTEAEDALCEDPRFPEFLARVLAQEGGEGGEGGSGVEGARLRSKAAFVLKALISAPAASTERVLALRPAMLGLLTGLEALTAGDAGISDPAVSRETCIEALLACARSKDGGGVVVRFGPRVSAIVARRRQVLVADSSRSRSEEDAESAEVELGLWLQWDSLTGPAQ